MGLGALGVPPVPEALGTPVARVASPAGVLHDASAGQPGFTGAAAQSAEAANPMARCSATVPP